MGQYIYLSFAYAEGDGSWQGRRPRREEESGELELTLDVVSFALVGAPLPSPPCLSPARSISVRVTQYTGHVHLDPEPDAVLRAEREKSDYDLTLVSRLDSLLPPPVPSRPSSSARSATPLQPDPPAPLPSWASLGLAVDAAKCGNEARFVNDYRGVPPIVSSSSSKARPVPPKKAHGKGVNGSTKPPPPPKSQPSAFFHSVRTTTLTHPPVLSTDKSTPAERAAKDGELRMGIWVLKEEGIAKGEEILIRFVTLPDRGPHSQSRPADRRTCVVCLSPTPVEATASRSGGAGCLETVLRPRVDQSADRHRGGVSPTEHEGTPARLVG